MCVSDFLCVLVFSVQLSLKETSASQRSMESQLMSSRNTDSSREFKIKEMEGRMRAMEKENEMLRQKVSHRSSPNLDTHTLIHSYTFEVYESNIEDSWQTLDYPIV